MGPPGTEIVPMTSTPTDWTTAITLTWPGISSATKRYPLVGSPAAATGSAPQCAAKLPETRESVKRTNVSSTVGGLSNGIEVKAGMGPFRSIVGIPDGSDRD